jgi:hypothetical protein
VGRELPAKIRANPIVTIPSHVVLIGRVMGLLSGVSRSLDSKVDLIRTVLPYALGTPPAAPVSGETKPRSPKPNAAAVSRPGPPPGV